MCGSSPSKSDNYNIIATVCGVMTLGIGLTSVVSNDWKYDLKTNKSGLWKACDEYSDCEYFENVPIWIQATRGFLLVMMVFTAIANIANFASQCTSQPKARRCSACGFGFAGLCGVFGAVIYLAMTLENTDYSFKYGFGFFLSWGSIALALLAYVFNRISANIMFEEEAKFQAM